MVPKIAPQQADFSKPAATADDDWLSDSGLLGLAAPAAGTATASTPMNWQSPAQKFAQQPARQTSMPYQTAAGSAAMPWTANQLQCKRIGLRLGLFGIAGMILPFLGLQLTLLNILGAYAQLIALTLFLIGWCLFAGAYLSRMAWCQGNLAALKIGGVLTGSVVVVLVFLFGALILGVLAKNGLGHTPAAQAADLDAPPPPAPPPTAAMRLPVRRPNANIPSPAGPQPPQPASALATAANPDVPRRTAGFAPPTAAPIAQAALADLQASLAPEKAQSLPLGKGAEDLTLNVSGMNALGGDHEWRMKQLMLHVQRLYAAHQQQNLELSGTPNDELVTVIIRPIPDVQSALRMIDFGNAVPDATRQRVFSVHADASKFSKPAL